MVKIITFIVRSLSFRRKKLVKSRFLFIILLLSVAALLPLTAESYRIKEVNYHIDGITREGALMKELEDLMPETVFSSKEELETFIALQQQLLMNLRQLKEDSTIEYSIEEGSNDVIIDVYTKDTWNIIVFPIPEYDSNNGFSLTLKYRDKNFFGTLERFALNFAWETKDSENTVNIDGEFTLPFEWKQHQWYWNTGADWEYSDGEHDLETYTGLGIDFAVGNYLPTFTVTETFNYDTADTADENWFTTNFSIAEAFDTGLVLPGFEEFTYTPSLYSEIDYKFDGAISESKEGLEVGFGQTLAAGRVDWIGNFRKGVDFSVANTNTRNLQHAYWDRDLTMSLSGYSPLPFKILFWNMAVSGRIAGLAEFDGVEDDAASYIRGIRDTKMGTMVEYGGFINTDLTMRAFTIPKFVEAQGSVYFDAGWVQEKDISFDPDQHFKMGVGIEAIGFPLFARSYFLRGSLGFDLKEMMDEGTWRGDNYELFIVLGHHY